MLAKVDAESSQNLWAALHRIVSQAHPTRRDIESAIDEAGLKPTSTPCVLLLKSQDNSQVSKVTQCRVTNMRRLSAFYSPRSLWLTVGAATPVHLIVSMDGIETSRLRPFSRKYASEATSE